MHTYNKNGVCFNPDRSFGKITKNRKKLNQPIYKCSFCSNISHLDPFFYDKLRHSKRNNPITLRDTNTPTLKTIGYQR